MSPSETQPRETDCVPKELAKIHLLGLDVCSDSASAVISDIARWVLDAPASARSKWFACINPHSYVEIKDCPQMWDRFVQADWIVPDGAGIVLAARYIGQPVVERITGADVFFGLNAQLEKAGRGRVFFLGSTDEVLEQICEKFREDYHAMTIVGTYSPPYKPVFSEEDKAAMVAAINAAKPDVLWVGMTAPKQEVWIAEHIDQIDVRFAGAIGAVFDFYVGNIRRSSPFWQRFHLEWLPRLVQEPRRLWRRMLVSAPIFVADVVREYVRRNPS